MKNRKRRAFLLGLLLSSILLYSDEVPNEKVTENPERKVEIVESKKLRDRAKLSIEINKMEAEKILGKLIDGKNLEIVLSIDKIIEFTDFKAYIGRSIHSQKLNLKSMKLEEIMERTEPFQEKKIEILEKNEKYVRVLIKDVNILETVYIPILNGNRVVKAYEVESLAIISDSNEVEIKADFSSERIENNEKIFSLSTGVQLKDGLSEKSTVIPNKMVVTVNGNTQTLEGNGAGIINQAITAIGEGAISLGINSSGNLVVKGIKESNIPATNVQIQLYNTTETSTLNTGEIYKTFNLEVKNEIEEMGTAIFEIDQRAFNKKKRYYMISNGKQVAGMNNLKYPYQSKEYKDMVNIGWFENEGELFRSNTKFDSSHVIYIKNGDRKLSEGYVRELGDYNYSTFAINSIATADIVFPRVEYSKLKELLVTYCVDETKPSHNYSFLFLIDGKKYSGSIKNQKYTANTSSKASIDLFYLRDTETTFVFPAKGIGEVESFNSGKDGENLKMKIASGAIPNPFGAIPSYDSKIIANKIKITNIKINGNLKASNSSLDNGNLKEKVENYEIGIDLRTGGLTLRKLDLRRPTQGRVEITLTYYYEPPKVSDGIVPDEALTGDAIAMDSIELTINDTTESIGSTKFEIDKRLGQINGEWLFPDGVLKASSGEKLGKYTKMLGVSSQYSNMLESDETKVTDVLLINENEDLSESIDYNGKKYKYEKDRGLNKIFLPFGNNVKLSSYKTGADSLLMVSIADIQVEAKEVLETRLKNSFLIRTENQHYLGEIEENYVGSGVYKGSGSIDLTTLKANGMKYTFIPDVMSKLQEDIRDVPAKETSRVAITEISGNFVDGRGVAGTNRGVNIANKIKVEKISNEKSITEDMAISENGELSVTLDNITFGIDEASGGLTISKNNNTKLKQVKISYYYSPEDITLTRSATEKDVLLGEFTLNIEDLDVEIDGDGTLDFGNLAYTEEHKKQTREERYRIKNLDNKKVSFGVSKENGEMYLTSDGTPGAIKENDENSSKISLTNISVEQVDNNTFDLQATAEITQETKAGNYSGEIEVTVTLDEKK